MTVGEKIQAYRKQLGMSQDELGQKLLVSRQTISLWEKDQTVPTVDNLMRLREIFGVSVDDILGVEDHQSVCETEPKESYQFQFPEPELKAIYHLDRRPVYKRAIISGLICIFLMLFLVWTSAPQFMFGFFGGIFLIGVFAHIKLIRENYKTEKIFLERVSTATYEYKIYEHHLRIAIYRNNEQTHDFKCYFSNIEQIRQFGKWLFLQFAGQTFIIRTVDLQANSVFFSYMNQNPSKTKRIAATDGWKILSIVLFVASLLSIFGAMALETGLSVINHLSVENMWVFFLFTPIPIASIVFGFVLKARGHKYKKNVIVGIIMTALLCIYGSFAFIFSGIYDHSDEAIIRAEQMTGIDIPEHRQINTQDWTQGTQSVPRGYIYFNSDVHFDQKAVEEFEEQLATDKKWMSSVSNDLVGITSPLSDYYDYDYMLICNLYTFEYNVPPSSDGTYRFINLLYCLEDNQMQIVEYDIDYIK